MRARTASIPAASRLKHLQQHSQAIGFRTKRTEKYLHGFRSITGSARSNTIYDTSEEKY